MIGPEGVAGVVIGLRASGQVGGRIDPAGRTDRYTMIEVRRGCRMDARADGDQIVRPATVSSPASDPTRL